MYKDIHAVIGQLVTKIHSYCTPEARDDLLQEVEKFMRKIVDIDVDAMQRVVIEGGSLCAFPRIGHLMTDSQLDATLALPMNVGQLNDLLTGACDGFSCTRLRKISAAGAYECRRCVDDFRAHPEFDVRAKVRIVLLGLFILPELAARIARMLFRLHRRC
jgi:hypothetical protein